MVANMCVFTVCSWLASVSCNSLLFTHIMHSWKSIWKPIWKILNMQISNGRRMFSKWGVLIPRELKNAISNHDFPFKIIFTYSLILSFSITMSVVVCVHTVMLKVFWFWHPVIIFIFDPACVKLQSSAAAFQKLESTFLFSPFLLILKIR